MTHEQLQEAQELILEIDTLSARIRLLEEFIPCRIEISSGADSAPHLLASWFHLEADSEVYRKIVEMLKNEYLLVRAALIDRFESL